MNDPDDDEALAPGHTAGPITAPASNRPTSHGGRRRGLIPFYKNARHWKFTNAQLLVYVGTAFAAAVLVLAGTVYYAVNETANTQAAVAQVDRQRKEGRIQRLESERQIRAAQARTDLEIARLACIQIKYTPKAKAEIENSLSPMQRNLIKNCKAIAARVTPVPESKPTPTAPSPSPPEGSSRSRSPLAGGTRSGPAPSPRGGRTSPRPSASALPRPTPKPSPKSSSGTPILNVGPVLCGVLGIECRSGA